MLPFAPSIDPHLCVDCGLLVLHLQPDQVLHDLDVAPDAVGINPGRVRVFDQVWVVRQLVQRRHQLAALEDLGVPSVQKVFRSQGVFNSIYNRLDIYKILCLNEGRHTNRGTRMLKFLIFTIFSNFFDITKMTLQVALSWHANMKGSKKGFFFCLPLGCST